MKSKPRKLFKQSLIFLICFAMIASAFASRVSLPTDAAGESGTAYVEFTQVTTPTAQAFPPGTKLLFLSDKGTMSPDECLLALPSGSAVLTVHSGTNTADSYAPGDSGYNFPAGSAVAYVDVTTTGTGFDTCKKGAIYQKNGKYYYYCNGSGVKHLEGTVYKFEQKTYTTTNILVTTKGSERFPLSGTLQKSQLNVSVTINGTTYTLPDDRYTLTDGSYDYSKGDNKIEIKFGNVPATTTIDIRAEEPAPTITMSAVRASGKTTEPLAIGEEITYTINITNAKANSLWKDVELQNELPKGLTFKPGSLSITNAGGAAAATNISTTKRNGNDYISANLGEYLLNGQSYTITYTTTVNAYAIDPMSETKTANLTNTAAADGRGSDGKAIAKAESLLVTGGEKVTPNNVRPENAKVDSTVENKTDDTPNAPTQAYDELGYTIDVKNEEIGSVWTGVTLTDHVASGVELKPGSVAIEKTCADGSKVMIPVKDEDVYNPQTRKLEYYIGDVYGGESYRFTFDVEVTPEAIKEKEGEGEDIGNTIKVTGNSGDTDTPVDKQIDDLYPVGTDKQVVLPGDPQSYMITTATNLNRELAQTRVNDVIRYDIAAGNNRAHTVWVGVSVHDVVPEGLEIDLSTLKLKNPSGQVVPLSSSVYNPQTREISVYLGDIEGGEEWVLSFEAKVGKDAIGKDIGNETWAEGEKPLIENIVTVTPGGDEPGETPAKPTLPPGSPYFPENTGSGEITVAPTIPVSGGDLVVEKTEGKVYPSPADDPSDEGNVDVNPPSGDDPNPRPNPPKPGILPADPEPKMEVSVVNENRASLQAHDGDILRYDIKMYNAAKDSGSYLANASIATQLPEGVALEAGSFVLTKTDAEGNVTEIPVNESQVVNTETGEINVPVGNLNEGEQYVLTYKVQINKKELTNKKNILTQFTVSGEKPDGTTEDLTDGTLVKMQQPLILGGEDITDPANPPAVDIDTDGDGKPDVNIDTDKDGKPDVNIDTTGDGKPDVNIDTNGDGKPDVNIDTTGDGKPDVNIDKNGDGKPDVNIDTNGDGKPDINIDKNGDGKPDVNIDTNGDGKPDTNIDTNGDGKPDINIDKNGDGKPDVNIDTDGDGKADVNIDTDGDGKPDVNVDIDGDGKPDVNIDTNGDGIPDTNLVENNEDNVIKDTASSFTESSNNNNAAAGAVKGNHIKSDELPGWIPRTGDTSEILQWFLLLGAAMITMLYTATRRSEEE